MAREQIIVMSPSDYALSQRLQGEVGKLDNPIFWESEGAGRWYNEDVESSEMAVRGVIRSATLERLGFQDEEWITREDNIGRSLLKFPELELVLGKPNFKHYEWQDVSAKIMGSFSDLRRNTDSDPIIDIQNGIVLFADEVQQLADGQTVVTMHFSGLGMGFVAEKKEVYKVVDDKLQRVRALLTD